ncbi:vacuolar protein sorting-associated protein 18 homolog [Nesidiocoris tenuis]|uniref:Vacuolar protein sorting-associated protein 18 homolog n=1 Tax=Nesidiocoris tenuis TaxID=355587 RepID=A0ABN7B7G2_9HEMI|nr:vacuolar protein sorting-associated protein 18 homolog [Nesidiocoris tenuis]
MASLLDQFERESQKMISSASSNSATNPFDDEDTPIFQKVKLNFQPNALITHMAVSSDYVVVAMSNNVLLRIDPSKSQGSDGCSEIDLNRIVPGVMLTGLFLDPSAAHLLICFSTELLYIHKKSNKPKPISKVRGHEITAIGWPHPSYFTESNIPKPVLLGSARGHIFEVGISADDGLFQSTGEVYCKQVWNLGQRGSSVTDDVLSTITGLEYHRVDKSDTYFVIATTQDRLYQFVGRISNPEERPLLTSLFNRYLGLPESFHSLPGSVEFSRLQLFTPPAGVTPTSLCWLTAAGIYYGQIDIKGAPDGILTKTKMYNFPFTYPPPTSFLMTEFHILFVYSHQICAVSSLSEKLVFIDNFNEAFGQIVNIIQDPIRGMIWVYQERAAFKYKAIEEDKHVWQIYAEKGEYEEAKKFCKNDALKIDKVLRLQAESFFSKKEYEQSAIHYAASQESFELVALKFLEVKDDQALKTFLKQKLSLLRTDDKAQTTMLVLWILELLLTQLGDLRTKAKSNTKQYLDVQDELDAFLSMDYTKECLKSNLQSVYALMSSHGDQANLTKLAKSAGDYDKVITNFIRQGDCAQAIDVLRKQPKPETWYTYLADLLEYDSKLTLLSLRLAGRSISMEAVLPFLVAAYSPQNADDIIEYLEFSMNELNCRIKAVHNFLLYLLAKHRGDRLMFYLAIQGKEQSEVDYDVRYAVRVCKQFDRREACVYLYVLLGLWDQAVDLALKVSKALALQTVSQPQLSMSQDPKKLWLKIAKHVIEKENNIDEAMKLVESCELLKIEDVLEFFPDVTTIDHFKDAICASLQEYNQHIDDLKEEMEDATKSAQIIRNEINAFRSRHSIISASDLCGVCQKTLLTSPFYSFPCSHRFHMDCLITEITPLLNLETQELLQTLLKWEEDEESTAEKQKIRSDLDAILAAQCLFCGDLMISLIDKPFIQDCDFERIRKEWE